MQFWRIFLWKNGEKAENYSNYLSAPLFLEDKLNEELNSGEIILDNMPISSKNSFPPKTKFRIERYLTENCVDTPKIWDMIVERDIVEEYCGVSSICCHRLYLIEPSAIAQGMHVDNISFTYQLQDVNLNYRTIQTESETLFENNLVIVNDRGYVSPIRQNPKMKLGVVHFMNSYNYKWYNTESIGSIAWRFDARKQQEISFTIPTLMFQGVLNVGGAFQDIAEMETATKIIKKYYRGNTLLSETTILERNCGPKSFEDKVFDDAYCIINKSYIGTPVIREKKVCITKIESFGSSTTGLIVSINNLEQFSDHLDYGGYYSTTVSEASVAHESKEVTFTTDTLTDEQLSNNERYEYEILCYARQDEIPILYDADCTVEEVKNPAGFKNYTGNDYGNTTCIRGDTVNVSATIHLCDMAIQNNGGPFLKKGVKYSAFELIRKALLTCDVQLVDNAYFGLDERYDSNNNLLPGINYPIIIDPLWSSKLKLTKVNETVFEQKNLWEVLIQVGYYLHAIPMLSFAKDGTDRFMLSFRKLGKTEEKNDANDKITVFNSQALDEYFSQYDSYVTNLFSPQNIVEEWIVPKSIDNSYLVSNNSASLVLKYTITELIEFDVTYKNRTESLLNFVFEESIYSILTSYYRDEYNNKITPSKGSALYFTQGDNKIKGLYYVAPSVNGDELMALKNIISTVFKTNNVSNIKFNDLLFHVKYRTQDTARITQMRPDLQRFMKNSSFEKYPHHEQFFGQQDKIIDSERFSANMYGKLIKVGNGIYQRLEYSKPASEKEGGDLVKINSTPYYVCSCENEYYPDVILQKVTYSKNFNQLSMVCAIPSEPRFYEVSERSKVRREIRLMEFFEIKNFEDIKNNGNPRFLNNKKWKNFIKGLLFNKTKTVLPNFAYTCFKSDKLRDHNGIVSNQLFPSTEVERTSDNSLRPKNSSDSVDCIVPVLHFPLRNGIIFEWDMEDNFNCGDTVDPNLAKDYNAVDQAYFGMQPFRYCDVFGRADLFNFKLFNKNSWTMSQARSLPKAVYNPTNDESIAFVPPPYSIGLDKDCREELSFNYMIHFLYNIENIVTFANFFGEKNSELYCCLLNKEVSILSENADINSQTVIADKVEYELIENEEKNAIEIKFKKPNIDMSQVMSIVFYEEDENKVKASYLVKNVSKIANDKKLESLGICPVYNED